MVFKKIMYVLRICFTKIINRKALHMPMNVKLGKNTKIKCNNGSISVGRIFSAECNSIIVAVDGGRIHIGKNVFANRNCIFVARNEIQIGNHCAFGPNVCIYDHDHYFGHEGIEEGYKTDSVIIEDNCWIGAGVIILRGSHIGEGCVIGAGCVIKGNIPAHSMVYPNRDLKIVPVSSVDHS